MNSQNSRSRMFGMAILTLTSSIELLANNGDLPLPDQFEVGPASSMVAETSESPFFETSAALESFDAIDACPSCRCEVCDCGNSAIEAKAAGAYKPLFYDNNFGYLTEPGYNGWHLGEHTKRMCLGNYIQLDFGGQYRARLHNERSHRGLGLTGVDDDFLLHRTRFYANAKVGNRVRLFAEAIDAESNYEDNRSRPIEVNRFDMQNLFADVMLFDGDRGDVWARAGRQELLYGTQRTVSPLDWANTRRTFEGYKVFWKGKKWALDGFYTRPVPPNAHQWDSPNYDQEFMGLWGSYSGENKRALDVYYLGLNNSIAGFKYDTLGGRLAGNGDNWQWELEGAIQFGDNNDGSDHSGAFFVTGLGRKFACMPWKPTLWAYYDWASGSNDQGAGHGYHHLFPLAHKYLGFMDLYGRRNIETPNVKLTMQPREKIQLVVWYYYFFLQNERDTPYNVTMSAFNPNNAPASADLGHEIDMTMTYKLSPRTSFLVGYSHFFAGDYYRLTPGVPEAGDADFVYTQFQVNF